MQAPKKRLGRGLNSLISLPESSPPSDLPAPSSTSRSDTLRVSLDRIRPNPHQPRQEMKEEELEALAASIRKSGLLQPVILRKQGEDYQLIAGERRWRACREAGLKEIPAIVREATDREMLELALVENIFREDLNPIERAEAYRRYADEFGLSAEDIAQGLGEDRTTVTNYMRLLDLPAEVRGLVSQSQLSMGHARCLLGLKSASEITRMAEKAVKEGLSVRALERAVRDQIQARQAASQPAGRTDSKDAKRPQIRQLEEAFVQTLGTKVDIHESRRKGSGKITIHYANLDDFDRIVDRLQIET